MKTDNKDVLESSDDAVEESPTVGVDTPKDTPKSTQLVDINFDDLRKRIEKSKNIEESVDVLIVGLAEKLEEVAGSLDGGKSKDKAVIFEFATKIKTAMPLLGLAVVTNTPYK